MYGVIVHRPSRIWLLAPELWRHGRFLEGLPSAILDLLWDTDRPPTKTRRILDSLRLIALFRHDRVYSFWDFGFWRFGVKWPIYVDQRHNPKGLSLCESKSFEPQGAKIRPAVRSFPASEKTTKKDRQISYCKWCISAAFSNPKPKFDSNAILDVIIADILWLLLMYCNYVCSFIMQLLSRLRSDGRRVFDFRIDLLHFSYKIAALYTDDAVCFVYDCSLSERNGSLDLQVYWKLHLSLAEMWLSSRLRWRQWRSQLQSVFQYSSDLFGGVVFFSKVITTDVLKSSLHMPVYCRPMSRHILAIVVFSSLPICFNNSDGMLPISRIFVNPLASLY